MHLLLALVLAMTAAVSGCTFKSIKVDPDAALSPPARPRYIVLGHVTPADPAWEPYRLQFAEGFAQWFRENPGVPDAVTDRAAPFPDDAVILMGTIIDVDEGSLPWRWAVGLGAGQAQVKGQFQLVDETGRVLGRFQARESYLGGVGIRGPDLMTMHGLVRRFSETVARSARRWANGEPVE
jgi:hypothetical protein